MSLTLEIFGLYPSCSRWEIVSRGAIGSELGLKDCSSLWAGKGPEGMRGNVDPLRFSRGRIFKYDQEERAGTQPGGGKGRTKKWSFHKASKTDDKPSLIGIF